MPPRCPSFVPHLSALFPHRSLPKYSYCTTAKMPDPKVSNLRVNYTNQSPFPTPLPLTPLPIFSSWIESAIAASHREPNAMCLSTITSSGRPSARMVLLKHFDESGFVFYTNYQSDKSKQLSAIPFASLTFWWPILERSVRIEGKVGRVSPEESDAYFRSRPPKSRLGAWASDQSREVQSLDVLEEKLKGLETEFLDAEGRCKKVIERPPHWGGFRVVPDQVEFWKGRESRLHDRVRYVREADTWNVSRLQP